MGTGREGAGFEQAKIPQLLCLKVWPAGLWQELVVGVIMVVVWGPSRNSMAPVASRFDYSLWIATSSGAGQRDQQVLTAKLKSSQAGQLGCAFGCTHYIVGAEGYEFAFCSFRRGLSRKENARN